MEILLKAAWFFTLLSMTGAYLNSKKKKEGFYFWIVTNLFFGTLDYLAGLHAQSALYVFFLWTNYNGLKNWGTEETCKCCKLPIKSE